MADSPLLGHTSDTSSSKISSSPSVGHRSSFAENLWNSPRSQRHPSLTQATIQDLINNPPAPRNTDPKFLGRDWKDIHVGELVHQSDIKWAELDADFESATKILIHSSSLSVILLREKPTDVSACGTFDYDDLNAYLLVVLGLAKPEADQVELFQQLLKQSQEHASVSLRDVTTLAKKAPLVTLPESADLSKAIELFGGGCHRILICKNDTTEVVGILSQLRLLQFMWENGANFPVIHQLYAMHLRELNIGTHATISINGDKNLEEALQLMNKEGVTSVAVVDNAMNVIGNISTADTRLLTRASSLPLLKNTCIHFISVVLTERGIQDGKDSFPVFHVSPASNLSQTVQKLIATRSHRMWLVESASPSSSAPATPSSAFAMLAHPTSSSPISPGFPSVPAAALPGGNISGRLMGVISLTDILNLFARQSGLNPRDPSDQRSRRRRSSSSSVRPSIDSARGPTSDVSADGGRYKPINM